MPDLASAPGGGEVDQPFGFFSTAAAGARDAGDRHGQIGAGVLQRARGHSSRDRLADRAMPGYHGRGHVQQFGLRLVRIGDETPLDHLRRLRPGETPAKGRARLAGFGLHAAQADTVVGRLSGGQKARLSLMIATIDAPHLLILDEPTNHLDIESREALVEALTDYSGAVILVSHDMHLLSLAADRLWLVSGGTVEPYDGDLESYRNFLLAPSAPRGETAAKAPPPKKPARETILALRAEVRKGEDRVGKLNDMRDKLAAKLANPDLYEDSRKGEIEVWQKKYAEVMDGLERAETLWMAAMEKLESAERMS